MCRFCLNVSLNRESDIKMTKISDIKVLNLKFANVYKYCTGIIVNEFNQKYPQSICDICKKKLLITFSFKKQCLETETFLAESMVMIEKFNPTQLETKNFLDFIAGDEIIDYEEVKVEDLEEMKVVPRKKGNQNSSKKINFTLNQTEDKLQLLKEQSNNNSKNDHSSFLKTLMTIKTEPDETQTSSNSMRDKTLINRQINKIETEYNNIFKPVSHSGLESDAESSNHSFYEIIEIVSDSDHSGKNYDLENIKITKNFEAEIETNIITVNVDSIPGSTTENKENTRDVDEESNYSLETLDFDNIPGPSSENVPIVPYSEYRNDLVVCPICGILKKRYGLSKHITTHRKKVKIVKEKPVKKYNRIYRYKTLCNICGKEVAHIKDHLNTHKNMPYAERPYSCPYCEKRFKSRSTRSGHIKTHTDEMTYKCPHCDEKFRGYHTKMQHITQFHTGEFRFECNICDRKFWLMVRYKDHLKRAHKIDSQQERKKLDRRPGPPEVFKCDMCDRQFKSYRFLREHIKFHESNETYNNDSDYNCPECGFVCKQNKELRSHIEKYHPLFELPPPNTSLKSKNLKNHLKKKFNR